jgi:hypothetical protein
MIMQRGKNRLQAVSIESKKIRLKKAFEPLKG